MMQKLMQLLLNTSNHAAINGPVLDVGYVV